MDVRFAKSFAPLPLPQGMTRSTTTTTVTVVHFRCVLKTRVLSGASGTASGNCQLATNKSAACRFVKDLKKRHTQESQDEGHLKVAFDAQRGDEREACQWELMSRISANCCGCQRQAKWATLKALDTFVYH